MAALSYSLAPTPPTLQNNSSSSAPSKAPQKENVRAVTTLGHSKAFGKITVHNVLSESNTNTLHIAGQNTIIRKIKDFGMLGAVNNAAASMTPTAAVTLPRKRPLAESKAQNEQNKLVGSKKCRLNTAKDNTLKLGKKAGQEKTASKALKAVVKLAAESAAASNKPAGTPGRKGLPLPQAVARRNARERNRVKQVNNGFAALRERIPEEVSEAFEAQGAGRGASKKLSKVETLRMAVEYIRSLERLLGFDFPPMGCLSGSSSGDDSFMFIKDEFDDLNDHFDDSLSNYELDECAASNTTLPQSQPQPQSQSQMQPQPLSPAPSVYDAQESATSSLMEQLLLPSVTTLNGLQYVRIPGTNTYQLLTPNMLSSPPSSSLDEEHFQALIDTNCLSSPPAADLHAAAAAAAVAIIAAAAPAARCTLSRSPVPQAAAATATTITPPHTSPPLSRCSNGGSSSMQLQPPSSSSSCSPSSSSSGDDTVSPVAAAAAANELLLQTCATGLPPVSSLIKQEYSESDFVQQASSPPASYHQQQQQQQQHLQLQLQQQLQLCSPVLPVYYDNEQQQQQQEAAAASYYDDNVVVSLPSFKKEFSDVLLDSSTATTCAGLSDESMIDAIDWWEAHTPKSDAGDPTSAAVLM